MLPLFLTMRGRMALRHDGQETSSEWRRAASGDEWVRHRWRVSRSQHLHAAHLPSTTCGGERGLMQVGAEFRFHLSDRWQ